MPNGLALAISLLVILMFLAYIVSTLISFFSPFYTTPKKAIEEILKMLKLKPSDRFVDLGSGDGRMVFSVHRRYGCFSTGYEISPVLLMIVKLKKILLVPFKSKVQFKEESFFNTDLSKYNVIYCCLPSDVLGNLEKKFQKELKKGTKVISYKNKLSKKSDEKKDIQGTPVYRYTY